MKEKQATTNEVKNKKIKHLLRTAGVVLVSSAVGAAAGGYIGRHMEFKSVEQIDNRIFFEKIRLDGSLVGIVIVGLNRGQCDGKVIIDTTGHSINAFTDSQRLELANGIEKVANACRNSIGQNNIGKTIISPQIVEKNYKADPSSNF